MSFNEIKNLEDLNFLLDNKISEGIDIDYKEKLPEFSKDESRLDFLRDICSFANTHGGQIIYGIKEDRKEAIPQEICGIDLEKPDHEVRKISAIVRESIDITLIGVRFSVINLPSNKFVLVINIPTSRTPPHRVKVNLDKEHRFYGRNDRGRYELSIYEIQDKIMQSITIREKIRNLRASRIVLIKEGNNAIELNNSPAMVLHIIPLSAFLSVVEITPSEYRQMYINKETHSWFAPFGHGQLGTKTQINLEGFLSYNNQGYIQCYREGIIEAVSILPKDKEHQLIHSGFYEQSLLKQKYFDILKTAGFTPPFYIFLSLLNIRGYELAFATESAHGAYNVSVIKYEKPDILLNEVVLDSFDNSLAMLFRPLYDRFCNAWGLEKCINYKTDGTYIYR